jgi:MinD superfamily P-loop ATPase
MSRLSRKFVAILMLLWLPLSSGSALAATISMQLPQDSCHEMAGMQSMGGMDMGEHHEHSSPDEHACSACGVCHLACAGYLAVPAIELGTVQNGAREATPYLLAYRSITFAPLVPPPLASA